MPKGKLEIQPHRHSRRLSSVKVTKEEISDGVTLIYWKPWNIEVPWPDLRVILAERKNSYVKEPPRPPIVYNRGLGFYMAEFNKKAEADRLKEAQDQARQSKK